MKSVTLTVALALAVGFCSIGLMGKAVFAQTAPPQRETASPSTADGNADEQFAQVLAKLTNARLERINRLNSDSPGAVASDDVALLRLQVKATDELQKGTQNGGQINWFSMLTGYAEVCKASADLEWKRVASIRERTPGAISELDAEMIRLRAQLADLNLKRGKAAAAKSADEQQNWGLQFLMVQMQELQDRVRVLETRE